MTRDEFGTWLEDHQDAFPELRDWLRAFPEAKQARLLEFWFKAFDAIHFSDAMECTQKMVAGQVEHPHRLDLSRLPAAIVKNTPYRVKPLGKVTAYNPQTGEVR